MNRFLGCLTVVAVMGASLPAGAETATLLGVYGDWTALQVGAGDSMTCFARSEPHAMRPTSVKRAKDAVYLLISDWPGRKVKAETQIVYGYKGNEKGVAALGVGADKFPIAIRNSGKDASGWLATLSDNTRVIDAMKDGASVVVTGTPATGAKTIDTYGLQGFGEALEKIHAACQM